MYETDIRHIVRQGNEEKARNRLRAFRTGWTDALNNRQYTTDTLATATWTNLGWRIGQALGPTDQHIQEELFNILADLQAADLRPADDEPDE